jgi:hypothetical protein
MDYSVMVSIILLVLGRPEHSTYSSAFDWPRNMNAIHKS